MGDFFCFKGKINEIIRISLEAGDKFMPDMHLK